MSSIAVVTNSRENALGAFLRENLESVLGSSAEIRNYYMFDLGEAEAIGEDVVLVMAKSKVPEVKGHVGDGRRIVVAQRTIRESEIYRICSIPAGAKALVVNDTPETTLETIDLLYRLELDHLNLVPFEPGKDYPDIRIAITPAEARFVPAGIGTIIDIGHRWIDISTFIRIVDMLKIHDAEVSRRLLEYSDRTISLDAGVKRQYRELSMKNVELDAIVNLSREGVLLVGNDGRIKLLNASLRRMLDLGDEAAGRPAAEALPPGVAAVLGPGLADGEVVEHRGRQLVASRREVEHFGEAAGTFYNFQEVTYIKRLERNLSKKLQGSGRLARYAFSDIKTRSPAMERCIELAKGIARSDLTVLITGESGTGKELLSQAIHTASDRRSGPFVAFNCAAVPESLMESELFGYEGGSFTGALKEGKAGLFEQANDGTVLLDEIGDMPYLLQSKLLRVLQERQVMRLGAQGVTNIDIRVIAATNHDLRQKIRAGSFREDLYYRLNVLPLRVPPLRERGEDVLFLLEHFLARNGKEGLALSPEAKEVLASYPWPGNIRELANVASYVCFMAGDCVAADELPYYLIEVHADFEKEFEELGRRCACGDARGLLESLADLSALERGAGRNSLRESLGRKDLRLSEGEVRRLLEILSERGYVRSSVGRRGSEITAKGKAFLGWIKER